MEGSEPNRRQAESGRYDTRLYARTHNGMNTPTIATSHSNDNQRLSPIGVPSASDRSALTTWVIGWLTANACNQPGIDSTGTNADDTNVRGNSQIRPNAWTASSCRSARPMNIDTQHSVSPNASASRIMPTALPKPSWKRNPTR